MDLEWALWETQKAAAFFQKAKNSLLDVCWTGDETTKATASNVAFQILSLRDDTGQKCPKTKCLIEQKVARYFSRLSALTKIGLLKRPPSVRRNSTDATKKYRPSHLTFLSNLLSLPTKTTGYVLGCFRQGKFAGSLLVKTLLTHSLMNFTSHAI